MVIYRFFKSGTLVPPPMEARKILIPRNLNVMISRYEWFLTYFCQQAKKVEQVIFCPMNVPQHPFLSRSFKPVMYRSSKTGHKQVIFSFGSVGRAVKEKVRAGQDKTMDRGREGLNVLTLAPASHIWVRVSICGSTYEVHGALYSWTFAWTSHIHTRREPLSDVPII